MAGYIGNFPTALPLSSNDLNDGIVTTAKLANDSVNASKFDETDNYTFTGTVAGVGGGGKLLQVVSNTTSTGFSTTSGTYVDTGFDIVITPSSTSNKVYVTFNVQHYQASGDNGVVMSIFRNDTTNLTATGSNDVFVRTIDGDNWGYTPISVLDSPNTTSAVTYTLYTRSNAGGTVMTPVSGLLMTAIAMEIQG